MSNVETILDFPVEKIARRLRDGLERAKRGGHEWIEGSLEAFAAMYDARLRFGTDQVAFGKWIKEQHQSGLLPREIYGNELTAMWHLGADIDKAREALTKTRFRTYRNIWKEAKPTYSVDSIYEKPHGRPKKDAEKPPPQPVKPKPRATLMRQLKLEDDYVRVQGTSLGSPKEMDALIQMRENPNCKDEAAQLIERAVAGEPVTATAVLAAKGRADTPTSDELIDLWIKHSHKLLSAFQRADVATKRKFAEYIREQANA